MKIIIKKITILFTIFCFLSLFNVEAISGQDNDLKVLHEKTYKISPGKNFKLETSVGSVTIKGWDKDEVYIKVSGNKNAEEDVEFSFDGNSERVEVIAKVDRSFFGWFSSNKHRLKFDIKVPDKFNTRVSTSGGNLSIDGVEGENIFKTSGGNLNIKNVKGKLDFATSGGDISFENVSGEAELSTSGGNIRGRNFSGDVEVSTSGGNIDLVCSNTKVDASTSGGNISLDYSGSNRGIKLSTSGGSIDINLPSDFNASAKLSTSGGRVKCEFTGNNAVKISSTKFEADINKGGEPLYAITSGGTIMVNKK